MVVHKDGSLEEEEDSKDYMAMHVFEHKTKGTKVLEDRKCMIRSTYSPEQTTMLYLQLEKSQFMNISQVLNLVLD